MCDDKAPEAARDWIRSYLLDQRIELCASVSQHHGQGGGWGITAGETIPESIPSLPMLRPKLQPWHGHESSRVG